MVDRVNFFSGIDIPSDYTTDFQQKMNGCRYSVEGNEYKVCISGGEPTLIIPKEFDSGDKLTKLTYLQNFIKLCSSLGYYFIS